MSKKWSMSITGLLESDAKYYIRSLQIASIEERVSFRKIRETIGQTIMVFCNI